MKLELTELASIAEVIGASAISAWYAAVGNTAFETLYREADSD